MQTGKKTLPATKSASGDASEKQRETAKEKRDLFRKIILRWYAKNHRKLPWRENPTPYRVWISEIMLQQTQAKTVIPYYNRFLKRYPNIATLAHAPLEDILTLWSGLGYYHRARNMHKTARKIVQDYKGRFPTDYETILSLPGIGKYTAGAICSIALNQPIPVVDGNIRRVLVRINGIRRRMSEKYFWDRMTALVPKDKASEFNQAIMELGALICLPLRPRCRQCPLKSICRAKTQNIQNKIPSPDSRREIQKIELTLLVLKHKDTLLLTRQDAGFIPGRWGLPYATVHVNDSPLFTAEKLKRSLIKNEIQIISYGAIRHSITCYRITAHTFLGESTRSPHLRSDTGDLFWADNNEQNSMLTSSLFRKALERIQDLKEQG